MTIDSVEFRKMQYARELAAHTLRQWILLCEDLENNRSFSAPANAPVSHAQQNSRTHSGSQVQDGTGTCMCFSDFRLAGLTFL
jgi:hypothetical protein